MFLLTFSTFTTAVLAQLHDNQINDDLDTATRTGGKKGGIWDWCSRNSDRKVYKCLVKRCDDRKVQIEGNV